MPDTESPKVDLTDRSVYATWATSTIRYSDLDPNGHVNNGAINAFFEEGRVLFRNERMVSRDDHILSGFAIVKFTVEYKKALFYPGEVDSGTVVTHVGNSSYVLGQGIFQGYDCIAHAEVVAVYLGPEGKKATPLGDELKQILKGALAP